MGCRSSWDSQRWSQQFDVLVTIACWIHARGRLIVGPGLALFLDTSLAEPECVAVALRCGKLLDSLCSIPACHGLGIARACVEDHFPEPERLGRITALFGQNG